MKYKPGIFVVCIAGLILRLYKLEGPGLWIDELFTFHRSSFSLAGTLADLVINQFPPFYYLLMNIWTKIFGVSEFALRFPSAIFSTLSIFFIFKLAKELYGKEVGFLSALLLCVSPYSINYAQEAKMYAMLWFFGILSFLFFYRYIKENKTRDIVFYVITTALSIYTMYVGFLYIVVQNVVFLLLRKRRLTKIWLLGQSAILLLYAPWIYRFIYHAIHRPTNFIYIRASNYLLRIYHVLRSVTGTTIGTISTVDLVIYCLLAIFAIITFTNIKNRKGVLDLKKEDIILLTWVIAPLVIYSIIHKFMFPMFRTRYAGFIHIPLIILFAKGLHKIGRKAVIKYALLAFLFIIIFSAHLYPYYKYGTKLNTANWREVFSRFCERADNNSLIMTVNLENFIAPYFVKNSEIEIVREMEQSDIVMRHNRIFIVYRDYWNEPLGGRSRARQIIKKLPQYKIIEKDDSQKIGYYWLEKR